MELKVILFFWNMCKYERKMRRKVRLFVAIFKQELFNMYVEKITIFSCDTENTNEFNFGPRSWNTAAIVHVDKIWTK